VVFGQKQAEMARAGDRLLQEQFLGAKVRVRGEAVPGAAHEEAFGRIDINVFARALHAQAVHGDVDATLKQDLLDALGHAVELGAGLKDHGLGAAVQELALA